MKKPQALWSGNDPPTLTLVRPDEEAQLRMASFYLFGGGYELPEDQLRPFAEALLSRHRQQSRRPAWMGILGCDTGYRPLGPAYAHALAGKGADPVADVVRALRDLTAHSRDCGTWWDVTAAAIDSYWRSYVAFGLEVYLFVPDISRKPPCWDCALVKGWHKRCAGFGLAPGNGGLRLRLVGKRGAPFENDCGAIAGGLDEILGANQQGGAHCQRIEIRFPGLDRGDEKSLSPSGTAEDLGWRLRATKDSLKLVNYHPQTLDAHLSIPLAEWIPIEESALLAGPPQAEVALTP